MEKGEMTVSQAGERGGNRVKEKHGPEYYKEIGRKSAAARVAAKQTKEKDATDQE